MEVVGITHYQKPLSKEGLFIEKKEVGEMDTFKNFFPFYFLGSLYNSELQNRLLFL